jgi:hypothetical protein
MATSAAAAVVIDPMESEENDYSFLLKTRCCYRCCFGKFKPWGADLLLT